MDLVDLELGKWIYLAIYLFFPSLALVYLIRTFGLEVKENPAESAQRHIEQADYWADIALNMVQLETGTKSLISLVHTIRRNLDEAARWLETIPGEQRQTLNDACQSVEDKLARIQRRRGILAVAATQS